MNTSTDGEWISVKDRVPPVGVVLDTKIDDGNGIRNEQQLVFDNPLWFFPDHKMYVYYSPTHWKIGRRINGYDTSEVLTWAYLDALKAEYLRSLQREEWINSNERLPASKEEVLVFDRIWKRMLQQSWEEHTDQTKERFKSRFSFWRPLPSPPKTTTP